MLFVIKDRIIIVIPYTSIIVQTAAVLRNVFGAENVVEHRSNFSRIVMTNGLLPGWQRKTGMLRLL